MRKVSSILVAASLLLVVQSYAAPSDGIFSGYTQLTLNGGPAQWYALVANGGTLSNLQSANLGNVSSLFITGGEADTYKSGTSDITSADLNWRVWQVTPSGSFTTVALGWTSDSPFNDAAGTTDSGTGDQKWAQLASSQNVLTGLTIGQTYTLDVYLHASANDGNLYLNNGDGSNYRATFTVIPEPSTMLLVGFGLMGAMALRRRKV